MYAWNDEKSCGNYACISFEFRVHGTTTMKYYSRTQIRNNCMHAITVHHSGYYRCFVERTVANTCPNFEVSRLKKMMKKIFKTEVWQYSVCPYIHIFYILWGSYMVEKHKKEKLTKYTTLWNTWNNREATWHRLANRDVLKSTTQISLDPEPKIIGDAKIPRSSLWATESNAFRKSK